MKDLEFCYLHPTQVSEGQCSECGQFICKNDYRLLNDELGRSQEWVNTKYYDSTMHNYQYGQRRITNVEMGPVIFCPLCYDKRVGVKPEDDPSIAPVKKIHKKKVLMCTQCGEKLSEDDRFCPSCGDSTEDEFYDSDNPIEGVRSSKKLR